MAIKYFGAEKYGLLTMILSLLNILSITNSAILTAARVIATKSLDYSQQLIILIKSFLMLLLMCITALCVILIFYRLNVDWLKLLINTTSPEGKNTVLIAVALYFASSAFAIFIEGFFVLAKLQIERTIVTIIANINLPIFLLIMQNNLTLYDFFLVRGVAICIIIIGVTYYLLDLYRKLISKESSLYIIIKNSINPQAFLSSGTSVSLLLQTSLRFSLIGLGSTLVWSVDNIVISKILGIAYVANYAIAVRLVTILFFIYSGINYVLSAYWGKLYVRGEFGKINQIYNMSITLMSICGTIQWIALITFSEPIINIWIGSGHYDGFLTIFAMAGYGYLVAISGISSTFLVSVNLPRYGIGAGLLEGIANLLFSIIFIKYYGTGGVALGTFIAALCTSFWIAPTLVLINTKKIKFNYRLLFKNISITIPFVIMASLLVITIGSKVVSGLLNIALSVIYLVLAYSIMSSEHKILILSIFNISGYSPKFEN